MRPTPFTRAVHARLVSDARRGVPASTIAGDLGWSLEHLRRVTHAHGIALDIPCEEAPALAPGDALANGLPAPHAKMLRMLLQAAGPITADVLAERVGVGRGSAVHFLRQLPDKLAGSSLQLTSRMGNGGGYSLVRT